ncbi:MAG: hypothetical protein ACOYMB_02190 [Patescibacteria group bacterium]
MPVLIVYGVTGKSEKQLQEVVNCLIKTIVDVPELALETKDVSVFIPRDQMKKGLGEEVIIFVEGLFDKPERTEKVRNRLAANIVVAMDQMFLKTNLIECFIKPFDQNSGFYSSNMYAHVKDVGRF